MDLTTLANVKAYLKIDQSQTSDDATLLSLIAACSEAIENHCERKFGQQTFTNEEYNGTGSKYILLRQFPIKSITSVSVDGVLIESNEYKVNKLNGTLIRVSSIWPKGDINVTVTYESGFLEIPAPVELACKHYVKSFFQSDVASFSTTFSEGFVFRADALPAQVKSLVAPYKKVM